MIVIILSVIIGIGVPKQLTPAAEYPLAGESAWLNWHHDACEQPGFWPMIYSPRDLARYPLPDNCAESPLLIGNECEIHTQCRATPAETAAMLYAHRDHPGPLYCCGSLSNDRGWRHTLATLGSYVIEYGEPLPLTGLHIHVYALGNLDRWRMLADLFGWQIVVSEYGCIGSDPAQIADCLPVMTQHIADALQPVALFWFSWRWPGYPFGAASLVDEDGYTVVGEKWLEMVGLMAAKVEHRLFVPGVLSVP